MPLESDRSAFVMPPKEHRYAITLEWTGNAGSGTSSYREYGRAHEIRGVGKPAIAGSSDPAFQGDATCWNPEELLVASLAACHQLWYLHLCAEAGIMVTAYEDHAEGVMSEEAGGAGQFSQVILRPHVTVAEGSETARAFGLHHAANAKCFIARSMNFPVLHEPRVTVGKPAQ